MKNIKCQIGLLAFLAFNLPLMAGEPAIPTAPSATSASEIHYSTLAISAHTRWREPYFGPLPTPPAPLYFLDFKGKLQQTITADRLTGRLNTNITVDTGEMTSTCPDFKTRSTKSGISKAVARLILDPVCGALEQGAVNGFRPFTATNGLSAAAQQHCLRRFIGHIANDGSDGNPTVCATGPGYLMIDVLDTLCRVTFIMDAQNPCPGYAGPQKWLMITITATLSNPAVPIPAYPDYNGLLGQTDAGNVTKAIHYQGK